MTNTITNIPLNKLAVWEGNVRKTQDKKTIDELAASIKAHGLMQNLSVIPDGKKFAVIAGGRRLAALLQLAKDGEIKDNFTVPCKVYDTEAEAAQELSLAENVMRVNMHPADEFDAFKNLLDGGMPLADVAARFGKTEKYVQQRLRLAKVSPKVLKAYRAGKLTLQQVQAFAVTDDHKKQNTFLDEVAAEDMEPDDIRDHLVEDEIATDDPRVKFVTLKAYEKAGGTVRKDLFSTIEDDGIIENPDLLAQLADDKLAQAEAELRKEGWKWTEARPRLDYSDKAQFTQLLPVLQLPPKKQAELDKLRAENAELQEKWYELDMDDPAFEELDDKKDKVQKKIDAIEASGKEVFTEEQLTLAGAIVYIGDEGIEIERGLVKPEDKAAAKKLDPEAEADDDGDDAPKPKEKPEFPASLVEQLTAQKSAALTATVMKCPQEAYRVLCYTLLTQVFFDDSSTDSALQVTVRQEYFSDVEGSKALAEIEARQKELKKKLPARSKLWAWVQEQNFTDLADYVAFCVAVSIDAVQKKHQNDKEPRLKSAQLLAAAVNLDMKDWFTATADNYFGSVGKDKIAEALKDVDATPLGNDVKKAAAAKYAEEQVAGRGWLPKILR